MQKRTIRQIVTGLPASDGAGVKLKRVIGQPDLRYLDPFLMLDEFRSDQPGDYIGGFPAHPHRGFETVTYMLAGKMRHADNHGHSGIIEAGGVQWMTAGRGIIHEEMPMQEDGLMWGFQLWVNLPAEQKMRAPRYQEFGSAQIPELKLANGLVRVVAGRIQDAEGQWLEGPVADIAAQPMFLDLRLESGDFLLPTASDWVGFVYLYQGELSLDERQLQVGQLARLSPGDELQLQGQGRAIIVLGKPIAEPVVQYGPFVMNSQAEIEQAIRDYQAGKF